MLRKPFRLSQRDKVTTSALKQFVQGCPADRAFIVVGGLPLRLILSQEKMLRLGSTIAAEGFSWDVGARRHRTEIAMRQNANQTAYESQLGGLTAATAFANG